MEEVPEKVWLDDLATIDDLVSAGMNRKTARRRVRVGRWTEPLPGVLCRTTGNLPVEQLRTAALLYGGGGAALSHRTAGALYHLIQTPSRVIDITVPHGTSRPRTPLVVVHQTTRAFTAWRVEAWPCTPPPRTAIDLALMMRSTGDASALLGRALQRDWATVAQLGDELDRAPSRGSMHARTVLGDLGAGSRSAAEQRFLKLVRHYLLPVPELNAPVQTRLGVRYIDALWRALGKGIEIDGQAFHLDPASWQADLHRQNAIQSTGIVLLRIAARRLWTEPETVIREVAEFLGVPLHLPA